MAKNSLIGLLMEEGEEDLAVLVARSELPDELDVERDGAFLAEIGLAEDDLRAMLPTISGNGAAPGVGPEEMEQLEQTISDRWAALVDHWTGTPRG